MKVFIGAFILFSLLVSCKEKQVEKIAKKENLVEIKDGIYTEWYPGKKNIKIQGGYNEQNWISCSNCKVASPEYKKLCPSCKGMGGKIIKGAQDEKSRRDGKWVFYSENGKELSITFYSNGLKNGFTMVKYPNGRMHYTGEYRNDTIVGLWTTYDENGKKTKEKNYEN
jgi:antitoxin component YwqK of YwqJK toxin-antitoxin module